MTRGDALYLGHIIDAIQWIQTLAEPGKAHFLKDRKTRDAILRNLEVIGEAVRSLSPELKEANPDIPWKAIAGMRDRLIHGYFSVDLELVWQTVDVDLAPLKDRALSLAASGKTP